MDHRDPRVRRLPASIGRLGLAAGAALIACLVGTSPARAEALVATPTPYLCFSGCPERSPLDGIGLAPLYLEDFEDRLLNTPGVSASSGGTVNLPYGGTDSVDADDGVIDGFGTQGHSFIFNFGGTIGITFTFDQAALSGLPTHAGIVWTDGGLGAAPALTTFDAYGPGMTLLGTIGPFSHNDSSSAGETGEDRFYGWTDPGGILAIHIRDAGAGLGAIEVDHLQYGFATPVPEPETYVLALVGLVLVGWRLRSKQRATARC